MKKLYVFKKGKVYFIELYGKEYELIMPSEPKKRKKKIVKKKE